MDGFLVIATGNGADTPLRLCATWEEVVECVKTLDAKDIITRAADAGSGMDQVYGVFVLEFQAGLPVRTKGISDLLPEGFEWGHGRS